MFRYIGMALGILNDPDIEDRRAEKALAEFPVERKKPVIERAYDTTLDLLDRMNSKARRLRANIEELTEELRQVEIVIKGASAMMTEVESGMLQAELETSPTPIVPLHELPDDALNPVSAPPWKDD